MENNQPISIIAERYSPFMFSEEMIEEDALRLLFHAAGRAPSSFNDQPWFYLWASKKERDEYPLFYDCLAEGNRKWAYSAPVLMLTIARTYYTRNKNQNFYALYETGMAAGNLLVQAMSMGIYTHRMGGYDKEKARKNLNIPDGFEPLTMVALGYPGDPSLLPFDLLQRATIRTSRKSIDEFAYMGKFRKTDL